MIAILKITINLELLWCHSTVIISLDTPINVFYFQFKCKLDITEYLLMYKHTSQKTSWFKIVKRLNGVCCRTASMSRSQSNNDTSLLLENNGANGCSSCLFCCCWLVSWSSLIAFSFLSLVEYCIICIIVAFNLEEITRKHNNQMTYMCYMCVVVVLLK